MNEVLIVAIVLVAALLAALAQYILKRGIHRFDASISGIFSLVRNRQVLLGLAIYALSLIVYLYALSTSALSFVYPTFASVFIFVLLFSRFFLHEHISVHRALGVAIVIVGIVLVALTY